LFGTEHDAAKAVTMFNEWAVASHDVA
jgi:hypothetical protein